MLEEIKKKTEKLLNKSNEIVNKASVIAQEKSKLAYDKYQEYKDRERETIPNYVVKNINEQIVEKYRKVYLKGEAMVGTSLLLESKLGGFPYLPTNMDIPKDKFGNDMRQLVQINCKDLIYLENFPHNGIIQIFISKDPNNGSKEFKIIYHNDIDINITLEDIYKKTLINELDNFVIRKECNLYFTKDIDTISINDTNYYNEFMKLLNIENNYKEFSHEEIKLLNINFTEKKFIKIDGNPNFTSLNNKREQSIILFQLVPDGRYIQTKNDEIFTFYIDKNDLFNKDFTNVKLIIS